MAILQTEDAVTIINRALALAEEGDPINSLEGPERNEQEARRRFDHRRRVVLRSLDWNFARRRVDAARLHGVVTPPHLPVALAVPAQCVFVRSVETSGRPQPFQREGNSVFTTCADAATQVIYTKDIESPVDFDPLFTLALEHLIAIDFARLLARSINRARDLRQTYEGILAEADHAAAQEQSEGSAYGDSDFGRVMQGSVVSVDFRGDR